MQEFIKKFLLIKKWSNLVVGPIALLALVVALIFGWWQAWTAFVFAFAWILFINSIWFVPTGNVGFKRVFGKQRNRSYNPGMNPKWPVITEVFLLDVMVQTRDISDTKKVITRNNVEIKATLTFQLVDTYAHVVFRMMGADYYNTHVSKWVDATFDTLVTKLTYGHFQAKKAEIEDWASKLVAYELAKKSSDMTEELYPTKFFPVKAYSLVAEQDAAGDPIKDKLVVGDDETEMMQRFTLVENDEVLTGVELFKNVSIKINEVKFEKAYEDARAQVAVRKAEVVETELKAEKARIAAKGMKDAEIIKAEGEAKKIKLVESAKNAKAKELGEFLKNNPAMLKRILFENFPKVFGGASPMLSVDKLFEEEDKGTGSGS